MRSVLIVALLASSAAADPAPTPPSDLDVGFRVGGYGFRREGDPRPGEGWTECRMNGVGVFGDKALRGPLFLEAGLDAYSTSNLVMGAPDTDLPIDRMSALVTGAIGARTQVASWMRAYVQVGGGLELTRVSVPYGDGQTLRDDKALPAGFFGVGVDLRIMKGTYIGAMFRTLVMANFNYDQQQLQSNQWVTPPSANDVFKTSPDLAAQGQFFVRHDL